MDFIPVCNIPNKSKRRYPFRLEYLLRCSLHLTECLSHCALCLGLACAHRHVVW